MKLSFFGGVGEVGRSNILLETDKRIMMDDGVKLAPKLSYPRQFQGFVDVLIPTHAHLDHCGNLPAVYDYCSPPMLATPPTHALSWLLIKDSIKIQEGKVPWLKDSFKKAQKNAQPMGYEHTKSFRHTDITFHDAGHIPGSAMIEVNYEKKKLLYTGDYKMEPTKMHEGAKPVKDVDVLITESTYSDRDHPPRKQMFKNLWKSIAETIEKGGNVLMPSFAVGRAQELIQVLRECDPEVPIFLDGMAKTATDIILDYPSYIRSSKELVRAAGSTNFVYDKQGKKDVLRHPSIIVATAGMLNGGPALGYLARLNDKSKVIFTGYCVEETNGWYLMNHGYIKNDDGSKRKIHQKVEYYDLSAHAGRSDLFSFVKKCNPEKVVCVHGEHCDEFASELELEGFDTHAPKLGETINLF
ncbi:Ribonuclease J [Candidatus Gugararchaeum adminiculabundum]|nr:Ribonuclease J [Candidatus Gugararchaeum adminiculabundum]